MSKSTAVTINSADEDLDSITMMFWEAEDHTAMVEFRLVES
jgi:hypothetical protein